MNAKADTFIAEIRARPAFAAATASDPIWSDHLNAIERFFREIDRRADDNPVLLDALDRALTIIGDSKPLKQRLLDLSALVLVP
jgi:hypothetical protein